MKDGGSVKCNSDLYKLDPVLEDRLLWVGGRLSRAAMPEVEKHPTILSKEQHVSKLVLKYIHQQLGHAGRNHMLSFLGSNIGLLVPMLLAGRSSLSV